MARLLAEQERRVLARFDFHAAAALGNHLVEIALDGARPIAIAIERPSKDLFAAAVPGSTPANDSWIARKAAAAAPFTHSSPWVGVMLRSTAATLGDHGPSESEHAAHGGAVPIPVRGAGVVAVAAVSGLPQAEDHGLVVDALEWLAARSG